MKKPVYDDFWSRNRIIRISGIHTWLEKRPEKADCKGFRLFLISAKKPMSSSIHWLNLGQLAWITENSFWKCLIDIETKNLKNISTLTNSKF